MTLIFKKYLCRSEIKNRSEIKKLIESEPFQRLRETSRPTCAGVNFQNLPLQVGDKNNAVQSGSVQRTVRQIKNYLLAFFCSHCWLAIPQDVLQADWQEVWHSPQPPFFADSARFLVFKV